MDRYHVSPALQRLWIDEVLHLHSLWHRGPPHRNPNPNPDPSLRPTSSTAFKKESKKKKKKKKKKREKRDRAPAPLEDSQPASEKEWPCDPALAPEPLPEKWSDVAPPPKPRASPEEAGGAAARLAQQSGLRACEKLFSKKDDSDNDKDEEEEEEDGMEVEEARQLGKFEFFLEIFENDKALREYYEKNCEKGEFYCLVCEGIGVKKGKRYGSCVGLVQHSNTISKTKRKGAHRAFARAICRVLGWNMERLPSIVLDSGDSLSQSLTKASDSKEIVQKKDLGEGFGNKDETCKELVEKVGIDCDVAENVETRESEDLPIEILQERPLDDLMDFTQTRKITRTKNEEDVTDLKELTNESAKGLHTNNVCPKEELLEENKELDNYSD